MTYMLTQCGENEGAVKEERLRAISSWLHCAASILEVEANQEVM
jgi:hypothetical protein